MKSDTLRTEFSQNVAAFAWQKEQRYKLDCAQNHIPENEDYIFVTDSWEIDDFLSRYSHEELQGRDLEITSSIYTALHEDKYLIEFLQYFDQVLSDDSFSSENSKPEERLGTALDRTLQMLQAVFVDFFNTGFQEPGFFAQKIQLVLDNSKNGEWLADYLEYPKGEPEDPPELSYRDPVLIKIHKTGEA